MSRLTKRDPGRGLLIKEEERFWKENGYYDKDEMYKIMRHLAEKLAEYEDLEEQGKLLRLPVAVGDTVYGAYMACPKTFNKALCKNDCQRCKYKVSEVIKRKFSYSDIKYMNDFFATREAAEAKLRERR